MLTGALFFLEGNVVIFGRMSFSKKQQAFIFILHLSVVWNFSPATYRGI